MNEFITGRGKKNVKGGNGPVSNRGAVASLAGQTVELSFCQTDKLRAGYLIERTNC